MIALTTPFPFGNGTRLFARPRIDEDGSEIEVTVSIVSAAATSIVYASRTGNIRNGRCTKFFRQVLGPGQESSECLFTGFISLPTGFTDAFNAYRTSRAAFEAFLLSSGILDSSLSGT